jgi:hypothetical protein
MKSIADALPWLSYANQPEDVPKKRQTREDRRLRSSVDKIKQQFSQSSDMRAVSKLTVPMSPKMKASEPVTEMTPQTYF